MQGDLITTWALLHLSGGNTADLDREALLRAIKDAAEKGAQDKRLLANACFELCGKSAPFPLAEGAVVISDPAGPYNPFLALASRDAEAVDSVKLNVPRPKTEASPIVFASWAITSRVLGAKPVTLTTSEAEALRSAVALNAPAREQLLFNTALAAGGQKSEPQSVKVGVQGTSWLVAQEEETDIPDLRASLLNRLQNDWK